MINESDLSNKVLYILVGHEAAKKVNVDSFLIDTDYNAQYEYPKRVKSLKNISELIGN